jgi:phosphoglycerate dehydrogenase-like enzyme
LPESDFVVICCQWTLETTRLFDKDRFAAKAGGVLINVARGEIVDEEALADALQRDHGAALDVYVGEFEHTPTSRLWSDPRVLITPHISFASDQDRHGVINLFCDNLRLSRGRAAPECHRLGTGLLKDKMGLIMLRPPNKPTCSVLTALLQDSHATDGVGIIFSEHFPR